MVAAIGSSHVAIGAEAAFVSKAPAFFAGAGTVSSTRTDKLSAMHMMRDSSSPGKDSNGSRKQYNLSDLEQMREAARSPEAFERFALNMNSGRSDDVPSASSAANATTEDPPQNEKKGYRPIEEWDEELKNKKDGSGMTWEEKVMYDGQRNGNQVRQNDILLRNLHTW